MTWQPPHNCRHAQPRGFRGTRAGHWYCATQGKQIRTSLTCNERCRDYETREMREKREAMMARGPQWDRPANETVADWPQDVTLGQHVQAAYQGGASVQDMAGKMRSSWPTVNAYLKSTCGLDATRGRSKPSGTYLPLVGETQMGTAADSDPSIAGYEVAGDLPGLPDDEGDEAPPPVAATRVPATAETYPAQMVDGFIAHVAGLDIPGIDNVRVAWEFYHAGFMRRDTA